MWESYACNQSTVYKQWALITCLEIKLRTNDSLTNDIYIYIYLVFSYNCIYIYTHICLFVCVCVRVCVSASARARSYKQDLAFKNLQGLICHKKKQSAQPDITPLSLFISIYLSIYLCLYVPDTLSTISPITLASHLFSMDLSFKLCIIFHDKKRHNI